MINIKVNDINQQFSSSLTIEQLVFKLQIVTNGIAIAINDSVIKKESWETKELKNNDKVLIIKSTQGG
ncbi:MULTISPECIES: sulfur carrier protein ThiS [Tenacibaculum]|uniref:sulfur carrier protein ThiS n=1 Tax=Tenacibaculum TaxID=104267 RepID=UPI0008967374|nr:MULTISPECIES: sulfur carrier protein ThiS [unclassified Tenacibaculum]RBW58178.1 sulfur carrier protein ThiS [Tenacibaculum sp. E3R01]SED56362.1 sulfur carrier protein ThiS [Tenacibaculum sp. MAR_2010_89]